MEHCIDLNSDIGESFGSWNMGDDEGIVKSVTSANVACGFHAGDPLVMLKTLKLCDQYGTRVGAHIGYPDLVGFGRRAMQCSRDEIYADCVYQIAAIDGACQSRRMTLQHVKPHGALYNQAAKDMEIAEAICHAIHDCNPRLILLGLANSCFEQAAMKVGVRFAAEAFADRGYQPDGSLVPRNQPGAIIHDPEQVAERVVMMVKERKVECCDGTFIKITPRSICFHGDTPDAVEMARKSKEALIAAGMALTPLYDFYF